MIQLPGDSSEYDLIYKGVELSKDVDGMCLEIGLRLGGGMKEIVDAIHDHSPKKVALSIDPFGHIPYEHKEGEFVRLGYTEDMKCECLVNLYQYVKDKQVHFIFFDLEDTEFFKRYPEGVPVYRYDKEIIGTYSFIHFDGPHAVEPLTNEINFFVQRINKGAVWCFDDIGNNGAIHYYDHNKIEQYLFSLNFELIEKRSAKAIYRFNGF